MGSYSSWSLFTHQENERSVFVFPIPQLLETHQPPATRDNSAFSWPWILFLGIVGEWINNVFNKSKGERGSRFEKHLDIPQWIYPMGHHMSRMRSIEVMYWVVGSRVYLLRVRELNCLLRIHKNIGEIDSEGAAYSVTPTSPYEAHPRYDMARPRTTRPPSIHDDK